MRLLHSLTSLERPEVYERNGMKQIIVILSFILLRATALEAMENVKQIPDPNMEEFVQNTLLSLLPAKVILLVRDV